MIREYEFRRLPGRGEGGGGGREGPCVLARFGVVYYDVTHAVPTAHCPVLTLCVRVYFRLRARRP